MGYFAKITTKKINYIIKYAYFVKLILYLDGFNSFS